MRKKIIFVMLVVAIVLQLAVPIGMIVHGKKAEVDLLENGFEYKFEIEASSMINGTLYYSLVEESHSWIKKEYGVVATDLNGYAYFKSFEDSKPSVHNYIRFTEDNEEKMWRFETDTDLTFNWVDEESAYVVIKVYDGNVQVVAVYIDNMSVAEWAEKIAVEEKTTMEDDYIDFDEEIHWSEN